MREIVPTEKGLTRYDTSAELGVVPQMYSAYHVSMTSSRQDLLVKGQLKNRLFSRPDLEVRHRVKHIEQTVSLCISVCSFCFLEETYST